MEHQVQRQPVPILSSLMPVSLLQLLMLPALQEAERQRKKEEAAKEADSREKAVFDMAERAKAAMLEAERRRAAEVGGNAVCFSCNSFDT